MQFPPWAVLESMAKDSCKWGCWPSEWVASYVRNPLECILVRNVFGTFFTWHDLEYLKWINLHVFSLIYFLKNIDKWSYVLIECESCFVSMCDGLLWQKIIAQLYYYLEGWEPLLTQKMKHPIMPQLQPSRVLHCGAKMSGFVCGLKDIGYLPQR